jgi:hypothetical protein
MWDTHAELKSTVISGWTEDDPAHSVHDVCKKLLSLSDGLGKWGRDTFGSVRKKN